MERLKLADQGIDKLLIGDLDIRNITLSIGDIIHQVNVEKLCRRFVEERGLKCESEALYDAALYHDIGKSLIEKNIIDKPGQLTVEERLIMEKHSLIGAMIMTGYASNKAVIIIRQHHEKVDGSGYPLGLRGHEMEYEAKILGICDYYAANMEERVYRPARTHEQTEVIMMGNKHLFDHVLLYEFFSMFEGQMEKKVG